MKQVLISAYGDPGVLKTIEKEEPQPQAGEVKIRVKAAGINFADILARQGLYPDGPKPPCVVGYEVAGVVETLGKGVDPGLQGMRVLALTRFGGYTSSVCVAARNVFEIPAAIDFDQAAGLPVNYLTAYQLLVVMGGLKKDESVLIHNAGGGVGLAALDIARYIGAKTFGTSSPGKHAFLQKRGLDFAIDYRTHDFLKEVNRLTAGRGCELVIDPLGGSHWKKSYKALRATGRLGMFGISTVTQSGMARPLRFLKLMLQLPWYNPIMLMNANKSVFGVNLGHLWHEPEKIQGWMRQILRGVDEGWARPHVDRTFSFEKAGDAHAYIEDRKNIGKVVLVPEG
jgi:NADPH:quinone reductase-like Zn-dependent oxidoreductase